MEDYSVLMSVYAKEQPEHFQAAVESMLCQTAAPDEVVLVCDGPLTPELEGAITGFEESHPGLFRVIRLKENRGLGLALREGMAVCRNELVARMDTDDIALPDRMEKQLKLLRKDARLSVVGGQIAEFQGDPAQIVDYRTVPTSPEDIYERAKRRNPMNHMTVVLRKSRVLEAGGYQHAPGFEDYHLWTRMLAMGQKLGNVEEICCNVRVDEGLYNRRGGWTYFQNTVKMERLLLESAMINRLEYCQNVIVRFAGTVLVPGKLRGLVFNKFLRKQCMRTGDEVKTV